MRVVAATIVVCAAVLTGACGVKGPLYMQEFPKDAPWPYVRPKPAPPPAPAKPGGAPAPAAASSSQAPAAASGGQTPAETVGAPSAPAAPTTEPKP